MLYRIYIVMQYGVNVMEVMTAFFPNEGTDFKKHIGLLRVKNDSIQVDM